MDLNKSNQVIKKLSSTGYKSLYSTEQANRIFSLPLLRSAKVVRSRSQYGMMLRESRKLSLFYGNLSKKYLQKIFRKSCVESSKKKESIFSILESRLDVILYRASFFETIPAARQVITIGGIKVNKKKVISPGYIVLPGDVVEVIEKRRRESNEGKPSLLSLKKLSFQEKPIEVVAGARREKKIRSSFKQVLLSYCKIKRQKTRALIEEITQALNRFKIKTKSQLVATGNIRRETQLERFLLLPNCTILSQFNKENRLDDLTFLKNKKSGESLFSLFFSKTKKTKKTIKTVSKSDSIEKYNFTVSDNFVFSNYKLKLEKQLFSQSLKNDDFYKQKKQLFFKEQIFFESRKTKPLHLEISFRSLSLIFLFPPQRICFPTFINLSLIYK